MLGKRLKRIYQEEKSGKESHKMVNLYQNNSENSLTQTTNLSTSNTPVASYKSEVEELKINENSQMQQPPGIFDKKELILEMISLLIDEFNCNH